MSSWFNYTATLKILVFGLLVGGALPALFAIGVRLAAVGAGAIGDETDPATARRNPVFIALSWLVFAVVLAAVIVGVLFIARDFIAQHTGWYILGAQPT